MEKNELIKSILQFNVSTTADFLGRFSESELKAYLDRVSLVCSPAALPRVAKPPASAPRSQHFGKMRQLLGLTRHHLTHGLTAPRVPS